MQRYNVTLQGETGLIMHWDNLRWQERLKAWEKDPAKAKTSIKGDDTSPAWRWIGNMYHEAGLVVIPSDNLMTMLREGGAMCPTGKGQTTYKRQTQSGIIIDQSAWPLMVGDKPHTIDANKILAMVDEENFAVHEKTAQEMGFELFTKRAKIAQSKHVRVRPRFEGWQCGGTLTVTNDQITRDVLENIITFAGAYAGLCDWRPSSPRSPGPWGRFTGHITKI